MEEILLYFQFDIIEAIIIAVLVILLLIQIIFYCGFYKKPISFWKKKEKLSNLNTPSVSVIITATDQSDNLEQYLPVILTQDYPDYEVIVVNNGLTDETDTLLKRLKQEYSHLYDTFLPNHTDTEAARKKIASTIGIKAAKNDILLFTEADTVPLTNKWISSMMNELTEDKDVVLGYCFYDRSQKMFNRIARYDNLLYSLQYLSSAIKNKPFTGIYRNVAYRKELFFDNKGFSSFLNYEYSENVFLNYIMNRKNTAVALSKDSFMHTKLISTSKFRRAKKCQNSIKKHLKNFKFRSGIFSLEIFSRYLIYLSAAALIPYTIIGEKWGLLSIVSLIFLIRLILALVVMNKSANYFEAGKFKFSFIFIELLQPVYNLYFRFSK